MEMLRNTAPPRGQLGRASGLLGEGPGLPLTSLLAFLGLPADRRPPVCSGAGALGNSEACGLLTAQSPLPPTSLLQVPASPDRSSPREEEGIPPLPRTRFQAGPRRHRRRALSEPAALSPDKATPPRTLEDAPLLLELQKLPGLANTDLSAPNPNIQVRATGGPWSSREELG